MGALALIFLLIFIGIVQHALVVTLIWLVARRRKSWARYVLCALFMPLTIPHFLRQALVAFRCLSARRDVGHGRSW